MKRSLVSRIFHASPRRQQRREYKRLLAEYSHHSDGRRIDMDWSAPNFNRIAVVNLLFACQPGGRYLEIGCSDNSLFDAVIAKHKVGVDPERGGTHRMTSDEYFRSNPEARFDVVFIDGLHIYEQVHRDVVNAMRSVDEGGWIALHDMIPRDWLEEHVPRVSPIWSGDVWKVGFELAQAANVDFRLLMVDHGVGVIRILNKGASIPDRSAELAPLRFGYFHEHWRKLPVLEYAAGREWIESSRA